MIRLLDWRVVITTTLLLAACAPVQMRPTAQVTAGKGISADTFASDDAGCRAQAQQQAIGLQTNAAVATAAALTASADPAAQQQYDAAYVQCMVNLGNIGPHGEMMAVAPIAPVPSGPGYDPALVHAVQAELIRVGMLSGAADGAYGPRTRGAITAYQQANNLPVNGQPSPALLANLKQHPSMSAGLVQPVGTPAPASGGLVAPVGTAPAPAPSGGSLAQPVAAAPAPSGGGLSAPVPTPAGTSNP